MSNWGNVNLVNDTHGISTLQIDNKQLSKDTVRREVFHNVRLFVVAFWLFVMMALPNTNTYIKYALLFLVILCSFSKCNTIFIKKKWLTVLIIWEVFFAGSMAIGLINGYELDFSLIEIYLVRPIIYVIICSSIQSKHDILSLMKSLLWIAVFISVYDILYIAGKLGFLPQLIHESQDNITIVESNFLSIRISNVTAMMFLTAFIFTLFFLRSIFEKQYRIVIVYLMIVSIVLLITSGRRGFQVAALAVFMLNVIHYYCQKEGTYRLIKKICKGLCLLFCVVLAEQLFERVTSYHVMNALISTVKDAFQKGTASSSIRDMQSLYMVQYWKKSPLFGNGIQAYMEEYLRWKYSTRGVVQSVKWSYEYFYLALLFQIGLFGIILVGTITAGIFRKIYKYYRKNAKSKLGILFLAIASGGLCFVIVGGTNPLVTSSWFWFIMITTCMYADSNMINNQL